MTSQQCNTNPYCMVVLHACTYSWASRTLTAEAENSPLCDRQHGVRQANPRFAGCIVRIIEVNTRCATLALVPAVGAATSQVLSTGSPMDDGHRLASYDTSLVLSGGVDCGRRRRNVYNKKKPRRYAKDNRTAHLTARSDKSVACVTNNKKTLHNVLYCWS